MKHPVEGKRLLIFDVDQTLRETVVEGIVQPRPPNTSGEWRVLPRVIDTLACYDWGVSHYFGLATNQGGVGLGFVTVETMVSLLDELCTRIWGTPDMPMKKVGMLRYCPHAPLEGCHCRKPSPFMLLALVHDLQIVTPVRLREVLYVGDQDSDRDAALRAGMDFAWSLDFFG